MVPAWLNSVALAKMRRSAKRRSHSPAHRVASARLRGTSFEDSLNGHPDAIDRALRSTGPDRALVLPGASKVHPGNLPATSPGNFTTSFALWIYTSSQRGARRCKLASCTRKSGRIKYGRLEAMIFEIALGAACGIVLAVLVLRYWSSIVRSSLVVLGVVIVLVAIVICGTFLWDQRTSPILENIMAVLAVIATIAITWRTFELLYTAISRTYPPYSQLYKGDPPWNSGLRILVRKTVIAGIWFSGAVIAALIFFAISHLYRGANF